MRSFTFNLIFLCTFLTFAFAKEAPATKSKKTNAESRNTNTISIVCSVDASINECQNNQIELYNKLGCSVEESLAPKCTIIGDDFTETTLAPKPPMECHYISENCYSPGKENCSLGFEARNLEASNLKSKKICLKSMKGSSKKITTGK